ncbi:MAG TPA: wax ester/triacylglycerol synthase family O-acyltransferase [Rubrivivax sp.]|nr:wax ester/triacylglycerol synthase family O-acyltransferase [Rubrivivax sp.]
MERLNPQDEAFLDMETATAPTHIGGLEIFVKPKGAAKDYVRRVFDELAAAPVRAAPFNYRLHTETAQDKDDSSKVAKWLRPAPPKKEAKPVRSWQTVADVDAADHVHLHALPWPGTQRELGELVSRLHSTRLDRSRPLWEAHLIDGLEGDRFALYTKLHHSQFDGKRGNRAMAQTRSSDPRKRGLPPLWGVDMSQLPPLAPSAAPAAAPEPSGSDKFKAWSKALQEVAAARRNKPGEGVVGPYTAPESVLNKPITARRRIATQSLSMERIKRLRQGAEATVNDVFLAVCGGALRRYLLERDALPQAPLVAAVPVAGEVKADSAAGNAVGQILVSLATNIADPRQRFEAVVASSKANKAHMRDMDPDALARYTELSMVPQMILANTAVGHRVQNSNLLISNVPGPRDPQYFNGALVEGAYAVSLLLAGQALNITGRTNGPQLDVGLTACADVLPSVQRLAVYLGDELGVLERALGLPPLDAAPARSRARATTTHKPAKTSAKTSAAPRKAAAKSATKTAAAKKATTKKAAPAKASAKQVPAKAAAKKVVAKKVAAGKKAAAGKAAAKKPRAAAR